MTRIGYLVLHQRLQEEDRRPDREAMEHKEDVIADDLWAHGKITDKRGARPFDHRLAELICGLDRQGLPEVWPRWAGSGFQIL